MEDEGERGVSVFSTAVAWSEGPFTLETALSDESIESCTTYESDSPSESAKGSSSESDQDIQMIHYASGKKVTCLVCKRKTSSEATDILPHPIFVGFICKKCQDMYLEFVMTIDSNGENAYCIICASYTRSDLHVCEYRKCGRAFCKKCLKTFNVSGWKTNADTKWLCLLCQEYDPSTHGKLMPKADWKDNLVRLLYPGRNPSSMMWSNRPAWKVKCKRLRVVFLFCGIGLGLFTLKYLGFNIDKAFLFDPSEHAQDICRTNHPEATHFSTLEDALKMMESGIRIDVLIVGPGWYTNPPPGWAWRDVLGRVHYLLKNKAVKNFILITDDAEINLSVDNKHLISAVLSCHPVSWNCGALGGAERMCCTWGNFTSLYTFPDPEFVRNQLEAVSESVENPTYIQGVSQKMCTSAYYGEALLSWLCFAVDIYRGSQTLPGSGKEQMIDELKKEKEKREAETGEPCFAIDPDEDGPVLYAKIAVMSGIPGFTKTLLQMNTRLEELRKYGGNSIEMERELGIPPHFSDTINTTPSERNRMLRMEIVSISAYSLMFAPLKRDYESSMQSRCMDYKQAQSKIY